jgi:hypothetical protein
VRIVGGALAASLSLAWLLTQRFRRGGRWRALPALIALPALLFCANELRWYRFQHELASAVQPVLGTREAGFGCERLMHDFFSSTGHPGHVWFDAAGHPASEAFLSQQTCADVKAYRERPDAATLAEVVAVHTVTHEAEHLAGVRDEATAECRALQADAAVLVAFGADPATARAQVGAYLTQVYPRLAGDYVSEQCRAGGQLDRTPEDHVWP